MVYSERSDIRETVENNDYLMSSAHNQIISVCMQIYTILFKTSSESIEVNVLFVIIS